MKGRRNPSRITPDGYVLGTRSMYLHTEIATKALGKPLPLGAEVHHFDGNPLNNANTNLVICENSAYHSVLHKRQRAMAECGNPDWLRCPYCKKYDNPANMAVYYLASGSVYASRHVACIAAYDRIRNSSKGISQ